MIAGECAERIPLVFSKKMMSLTASVMKAQVVRETLALAGSARFICAQSLGRSTNSEATN